jgi:hypothetical protein
VSLDTQIDDLYRLPLSEFTTARNALAKTVKGDQAARVKRLEKPTVVPWTLNQLYWRERKTFDRLIAAGRALRDAQIAALKGKGGDLRAAASDHRAALADAVATATQLAAQAGAHPQAEPLSRMLEALSLAPELPPNVGRLTDVIQPAGFEALAGVTPVAQAARPDHTRAPEQPSTSGAGRTAGKAASAARASVAAAVAEKRRAEEAAAARRAALAAVHAGERTLDRARAALARADAHADAVRQQFERAEKAVADARSDVTRAEQELADARAKLGARG